MKQKHITLPSALFLGDSISREIYNRYQAISPGTKVVKIPSSKSSTMTEEALKKTNYEVIFISANPVHLLAREDPQFSLSMYGDKVRGMLSKALTTFVNN